MTGETTLHGRGARSNASGRYERERREGVDDGWTEADPSPPPRLTRVETESARTILSFNKSPDLPFDRAVNPYRGCEHGCSYCYARPNHAYAGLSPGVDFESRLFAKPDAPALLRKALARKGYQCRPIMFSGVTDAYQPIERTHRITRACLEVLAEANHPVTIITKSALILRDVDILGGMAGKGLAKAALSITTLDRGLARAMEPRAATPERRLDAVRGLNEAGVPVKVMAAPMIPGLNDHELEAILTAGRDAGARTAGYVLLRMPHEIKDLFREWLETTVPNKAAKVISLIRQCRNGRDYDPEWGKRGVGEGPLASLLAARFKKACARLGFEDMGAPLRTDLFRPPAASAQAARQGDLFESPLPA